MNQREEEENKRKAWYRFLICGCCSRIRGRLDDYINRVAPVNNKDAGEDIEISYDALVKLMGEFKEQMEVLKSKMKSEGPAIEGDIDGDGVVDDEEALIKELNELREFVTNNKECIEDFFHIKRSQKQDPSQDHQIEEIDPEQETPEDKARRLK